MECAVDGIAESADEARVQEYLSFRREIPKPQRVTFELKIEYGDADFVVQQTETISVAGKKMFGNIPGPTTYRRLLDKERARRTARALA